jgi:arylsulfatase A-like enzyme
MGGTHAEENDPRPNIILVMADDQGWGDMGYHGHPVMVTPNFDDMASQSIRFDHFYAAAPVCSPTRGSVLTGRHPNRFGCFSWGYTLRPQEITIAKRLKEAGYATAHFGKWHLGSVRIGSPVNPGQSGFDEWFSSPNFFDNDPIMSRNGVAVQTSGESSMVTVDAALEWIFLQEGKGIPYFAVIWFGSPHLPHISQEEFTLLYPGQTDSVRNFYGEITGMDLAFGKLRHTIRQLNSYENTILWYCSDNGGLPEVGSTGGRGHKGQIYEGGLRIPSMLEWPGKFNDPGIISIPASTSDIFPTLLEATGLEPDPERTLDGISLLPWLKDPEHEVVRGIGFWSYPIYGIRTPSMEWMAELYEAQKNGNMVGDSSCLRLNEIRIRPLPLDTLPGHAAWLQWPWKLHRIQDAAGKVTWELYDLQADSMEIENLFELNPERAATMGEALERWQHSVLRSQNGGEYGKTEKTYE